MYIVGKCLSKLDFSKYVSEYNFGTIPPNRIVLHHTWSPTKESWNGKHSIIGLKQYYESKGWQTAPHLFIAEDGIWLFTPFYDVGVHSGKGNATYENKFTKKKFNGYIGSKGAGNWQWKLQDYSIGIEMVGNYDTKKPNGKTWDYTLFVIKKLMERLKMRHDALHFHRDYSTKTCPGAAITRDWVYKELEDYGKPKGPLAGVPNNFKEGLFWEKDQDHLIKLLYQYHKKYHNH